MKNVLLITDDNDLAHGFHDLAKGEEFDVRIITHNQAVETIDSFDPHIIILDVRDENDLRMCSEIRNSFLSIPLIIIASNGSEESAIRSFRYGAWDYFRKPVDFELLKKGIDIAIKYRSGKVTREEYLQQLWLGKNISHDTNYMTRCPFGIRKVLRHMELNKEKALALDDMAEIAGMSKYHFCRTFKQYIKTSPVSYLHKLKIDKAKEILLANMGISITEVAFHVGYNTVGGFERMFRKMVGLSPRQFKNIYSRKMS